MAKPVNPELKKQRTGAEKYNNQGCLMRIANYISYYDVEVEFFEPRYVVVHARYDQFNRGCLLNPYHSSVFGKGSVGIKYPISENGCLLKEYKTWVQILRRACSETYKIQFPAYQEVSICNEWLCYENFYEWIHAQENFDKWLSGERWAIDKDILIKGNKQYSPNSCCLVPQYINNLFITHADRRGELPLGVTERKKYKCFRFQANSKIGKKAKFLGDYCTIEEAFGAVKKYTEKIIRQRAQEAFDNHDITQGCYQAMMNYEIEITD